MTRLAETVSLDALSVADWDLDVTDDSVRDADDLDDDEIDRDLDAALVALDADDADGAGDDLEEDFGGDDALDDLVDAQAEETV